MATNYPTLLQGLLEVISGFRACNVTLEDMQAALWEASGIISSPEERALAEMLRQAEGRLEIMKFTVEPANVFAEADAIAQALGIRIKEAMLP